ncbi:hypothetical protein PUATCC27989T_00436 [Phytobacter ursingii]|nr:hypothetical protein PUATCC27989T_00436 [Phytobacter ursingii]
MSIPSEQIQALKADAETSADNFKPKMVVDTKLIRSLLAEHDADKALIAELRNDVDAANARVDAGCAQLCNQDDLIGTLRDACSQWERKAISNFEECAEMSARIEELESQRKLAFTASNRWADKFRDAQKRIVELEGALNLASASYAGERERADALQARTLTVKLPRRKSASYYVEGEFDNSVLASIYNTCLIECEVKIKNACAAASITLVVGE